MAWTSKIVHIYHQMEAISKLATAPVHCIFTFIRKEIVRNLLTFGRPYVIIYM